MSTAPLRILLINQGWFAPELREMGHTVFAAGWVHDAFDFRFARLSHVDTLLAQIPEPEKLDAVVYFDDSHSISLRGLETLQVPSLLYSVDVHHHWRWHSWFALMFERMLVAQKDYLLPLLSVNSTLTAEKVQWFPLWAPAYMEPVGERDRDVSFRGNLDPAFQPVRAKFFQEVGKQVSLDVAEGPYAEIYQRSKIVLNQCVGDDVNFRIFEALMSGALLVTPRMGNGLPDLFEEGRHLLCYENGNATDAVGVIKASLADEPRRARIAAAGRAEVLKNHTAMRRAEQLCKHIRELRYAEKPLRYMAAAMSYLHGLENFRQTFDCDTEEARTYRDVLALEMRDALLLQGETGASVTEEHRALILTCKCYLELILTREALLSFSSQMRERYPDDLMLNLSYIDDLIALGRTGDANRAAAEISNAVPELLASLPLLLEDVRKRVLAPQKEKLGRV